MLSDGIDSPVAGFMISRKLPLDALHFINGPDSEAPYVKELVSKLSDLCGRSINLYLADHRPNQEVFRSKCHSNMQCILCKRMIHRVSERFALEKGYDFIVNGENLGQVASQTLSNMKTIHYGLKIRVLQPLLALDKRETIDIAKKIGTYEASIKNKSPCPYVPKDPKTGSKIENILKQEMYLDIESLVESTLKSITRIRFN
jgi:tRNA uracil 4-sulfurtransferase